MTFLSVIFATTSCGLLSLLIAAYLTGHVTRRWLTPMVAFAAGVVLAIAFLDLLPEAFQSGVGSSRLFSTLLAGLLFFFLLQHVVVWQHDQTANRYDLGPGLVPLVLLGDGVHKFADGVLIAAAFLADPRLGWSTALAVFVHEIPHKMGDFIMLRAAGIGLLRAVALNLLSGTAVVCGGVIGYAALSGATTLLPYALVVAASSFVYIAIADLLPLLQRSREISTSLIQAVMLAIGIAVVVIGVSALH